MGRFFKGTLCGFLNGFFGSGGGVIAVPILEKEGCPPNEAHATSVALIFLLSLLTAGFYGISGGLDFAAAWQYIPWGVIGAVAGSIFLKKIKASWLKRLFGGVVTAAAVRMLFS
ncbi:MAG: sulfite exporter TauE/SafE family protein [Lachnospiraceae bacterium]|nr:sulfite exporter TauE/SafE family protein [Ruminococcus sp.]MCM1275098.1 sulfite exporter TauE/SafE family protein [Lachnospiraceae bacterium]